MSTNIVAATIAEAQEKPDKEHVLHRLKDWQNRVHALYDCIEQRLGDGYTYDRTGKHMSQEEMVQRTHLGSNDVPQLDILTVEQGGRRVAELRPRGLWIIGANGRVDLIVMPRSGGSRLYMLLDHSLPLSGETDWRIVRPSDRLHQPRFRPEVLSDLLE